MCLVISTERAEVSSKGFMLIVTKVPLEVVALAADVSLSVVLLLESKVSTMVSGVANSVVPAVDKVSEEVVVPARYDFASVKSGKADISGVDKVFPPVGLWSMSEAPGLMAIVSISVTPQLITSMSVPALATKTLDGEVMSGDRVCEMMMAGTELLSKARALASAEV